MTIVEKYQKMENDVCWTKQKSTENKLLWNVSNIKMVSLQCVISQIVGYQFVGYQIVRLPNC